MRLKSFRAWAVLACALMLSACSTVVSKQMLTGGAEGKPKKIVVFFDGTHNDVASDTNVKRLHSLVTLQARDDLATIYIEGVGVESDVFGMGLGLGIGARVRLAYQFLLDQYRPQEKDQIYIFGFSRGAYAARMLASMLYYGGLPDARLKSGEGKLTSEELAREVFDAVKYEPEAGELPAHRYVKVHEQLKRFDRVTPVSVEMLGLWDTVEDLGWPRWSKHVKHKLHIAPFFVDVDEPNERYGDQLCNVVRAYQALSIDDDREWAFTPLLLSREHLFQPCQDQLDVQAPRNAAGVRQARVLQEVWFAGAHSDVGGGYEDSLLSGVSLNWMIQKLTDPNVGLLPRGAAVAQNPYGTSHNPESGWAAPIYHAMTRNMGAYVRDAHQLQRARDVICVDPSVFDRRKVVPPKDHENDLLKLTKAGDVCLVPDDREGLSNPQRLRQPEEGACPGGAVHVEVKSAVDCYGSDVNEKK
jgi:uncharacterized protein (DUF2235 family)